MEIIATRQRREQAWHARLLICTTVISYLDSSLVNFTKEIEKEEVAAFKAYLRQAIANFAAADSPPSPPQVPIHTRPKKGSGKGIDKNLAKKTTVATPQIILSQAVNREMIKEVDPLKIPKASDKTWAVVARKGYKKARIVNNNQTQAVVGNKSPPKPYNKNNSSTSVSDKRLFVRLPQEHEWRKLSPAGIREVAVKKLSISPALIGKIKPVHSGFALSPCSTEARDKISTQEMGSFCQELN
ncbi:putative eka-like protein [Erysiphe necator]|uniref:Putative eka-like protein n=1 Tax=Uncinula necator TaxID=52586 RepID=A0A0B1P5S4_UNCNE|nr:putative eka-like protein [Erysiphe necator]